MKATKMFQIVLNFFFKKKKKSSEFQTKKKNQNFRIKVKTGNVAINVAQILSHTVGKRPSPFATRGRH